MTNMTQMQKRHAARAMEIAGWPVRFVWTVPQAGFNAGTMADEQDGFWVCDTMSGSVVMDHDGPGWSRPVKTEFVEWMGITVEQMREAAKVAERVAQEALRRVAQPVGEWQAPSEAQMVKGVRAARKARIEAWAWNVAADQTERGMVVSGRARDILMPEVIG